MKRPLLIAILLTFGASAAALACSAIDKPELVEFHQPGVPPALFAKIYHAIPLDMQDVITLSQAHVRSGSIVEYLTTWGRHMRFTAEDVAEMKRAGVSTDLIDYITSPDARPHLTLF